MGQQRRFFLPAPALRRRGNDYQLPCTECINGRVGKVGVKPAAGRDRVTPRMYFGLDQPPFYLNKLCSAATA